jgi:hypothetical protein
MAFDLRRANVEVKPNQCNNKHYSDGFANHVTHIYTDIDKIEEKYFKDDPMKKEKSLEQIQQSPRQLPNSSK